MLAKLLLEKPSILMLDEPTNHLDLPSIKWIENYLKNYDGSVVIVSHDKVFLDNTISKIIEVNNGKLNSFSGNYSFYLSERVLRDEIQKNAFLNQQQKIKQTEHRYQTVGGAVGVDNWGNAPGAIGDRPRFAQRSIWRGGVETMGDRVKPR